jgi:hypothetical protein
MRHRTGLPTQRSHRGAHRTATVAHPIATNSHFYAVAATTTFRRDELSFPVGLGDRTHRRTRLATTMRSSSPSPVTAGNNAGAHHPHCGVSPARPTSLSVCSRASPHIPEHLTATTAPFIVTNPVVHRQQRSTQRHDRRDDRSRSRLRLGSHPEVTTTTEPRIATSGAPTVSLGAMTAPDAEPSGRMRDSTWVAIHQAPRATAR